MMVHLCILTSLQHINGWEKDCVTAVFNEELLSQSITTLSGVDSWFLLAVRTRAVHGNSTRGFAVHNFSIRPPERELALPLETARRRRRRRRRPWTKFLHGVALQISRSHRKRTQFPRPDARSIATIPTAPWAKRRRRARELRLAAPSIRFVLQAAAAQQRHEHLELSQCGSQPQLHCKPLLATARHMRRYPALQPLAGLDLAPRVPRTPARRLHPARSTPPVLLMREGFPPRPLYQTHVEMLCFLQCFVRRMHGILPKMDKSRNIAADAPLRMP